MALSEYNEGATVLITATFRDDAGTLVVPSEAKYQVDDVESGDNVVPLTAIPGTLASAMEIAVSPTQNAIIESAHRREERIVTVRFKYGVGGAKQGSNEYRYLLKNLNGSALA